MPYELPAPHNYANPETMVPDIPTFGAPAQQGGGGGMFWLPAAITGAASIFSGILGNRSQNRATEAQERMFGLSIEEQRRQQRNEQIRLAAMWDNWNARRSALMARYGLEIPQSDQGGPNNPFVGGTGRMYGGFSGDTDRSLWDRGENLADLAASRENRPPRLTGRSRWDESSEWA